MTGLFTGGILAIIAGILILKSLKGIFKIVLNIIGGVILLYIFNYVGSFYGIGINYSFQNLFLVGVGGVPGIIVLALMQLI
ncbi:pro-sigmaK processing inhibitor BofA family protein [Peptoniphilus sp. GNH]|nr:hypothetical protein HMPREF3189_00886 [Clostridiales bacterium KA00134]UHR03549.1 pro-sigmaK processing inhibitor BofA family protein [Peptoniphilus sp. GNH]